MFNLEAVLMASMMAGSVDQRLTSSSTNAMVVREAASVMVLAPASESEMAVNRPSDWSVMSCLMACSVGLWLSTQSSIYVPGGLHVGRGASHFEHVNSLVAKDLLGLEQLFPHSVDTALSLSSKCGSPTEAQEFLQLRYSSRDSLALRTRAMPKSTFNTKHHVPRLFRISSQEPRDQTEVGERVVGRAIEGGAVKEVGAVLHGGPRD